VAPSTPSVSPGGGGGGSDELVARAVELLNRYRLRGSQIFTLGTFDKGITVLSQQVRALNLAWGLVEAGELGLGGPTDAAQAGSGLPRKQVAIVGAGFAGLTLAAGLLKKRVNADITIFERRDTVLPLQHGSDSRWLHPHIYDWPSPGSEAFSAALPVMNWTASRASDVVVQVLKAWQIVAENPQTAPKETSSAPPTVEVFCNTHHLQASRTVRPPSVDIEWIGEPRDSADPAVPLTGSSGPIGESRSFDLAVLAVGFGLETGGGPSYWRNETLAQPQLGQARNTYIVSGSGDGAMIDLCRLRISLFRQDRILADLFQRNEHLVVRLREIQMSSSPGPTFETLSALWGDEEVHAQAHDVLDRLRDRMRQDTNVLLRVRQRTFASLFEDKRVSFQNRLLAFMLYRCGAFTPVRADDDEALAALAREHGVTDDRIIVRHGTEKLEGLTDVLAEDLHEIVEQAFANPSEHHQSDEPTWTGGYFDMPGLTQAERDAGTRAADELKDHWRSEYLPGPVQAISAAFCSAVGALLATNADPDTRLRVTLHRVLHMGREVVLQQCCDYQGLGELGGGRAGRTFPSHNGTIGAAFALGTAVRTREGATRRDLEADMRDLSLNEASKGMAGDVSSVAAIPLLGAPAPVTLASDTSGKPAGGAGPANPTTQRNVIGVLYLDSYESDAFLDETTMGQVRSMCGAFLGIAPSFAQTRSERIANTEYWRADHEPSSSRHAVTPERWGALETVPTLTPQPAGPRRINFDFSDFAPVEQR
jgi:hypothetical protein